MQGACRLIDDRHELGRHAAERSGPVISPLGWGLLLLCGRTLSTVSAKGCTVSPQMVVRWSDPGCQRS